MAGRPPPAFLSQAPPPGYVAGLGRGATGFTTRSDIGPARAAAAEVVVRLSARAASSSSVSHPAQGELGRKAPAAADGAAEGVRAQPRAASGRAPSHPPPQPEPGTEGKFDEQMGNDGGLFAGGEYDEDDREADKIWEAVDDHMDSRRRDLREARLRAEAEKFRASNPKIT